MSDGDYRGMLKNSNCEHCKPKNGTTEVADLGLSRALHEPSSTMMNGASYTARMHGALWVSPQTMPLSSIRPRQQADCQRGRGGNPFVRPAMLGAGKYEVFRQNHVCCGRCTTRLPEASYLRTYTPPNNILSTET